ncbi:MULTISPECIES: hypothetical protein [Streptomyces]|uniref:hypothetical protein n=1 Tax=Streptomyces TaxID=1883 RepID=UPI0011622036|nr:MULTISPECIES: hypothetical protein [Streptomyces]MCX5351494.1 hypothetical protein [Streptomyces mirabilis]QDN59630.1 hypothetical protein FNV67_34025 [Streptomyces sp. S1D4-20]QDN69707.1 hypothetical protein FNV66_33045 [Streptomyces sp. S1D4-14]QDO52177.1 hypothetical protein FNV60_31625 [Streptomyces sp. RLB3-5]QDO62419.1 hypothetical protein FNV59_33875 [Streptomyces sp. RLB1-8]
MSLVDLIARADERGLAASGLACLDRCVPLLGGDDEVLRPLWSSLADGGADGDAWGERLAKARAELDCADPSADTVLGPDPAPGSGSGAETETETEAETEAAVSDEDRAAALARRMLATAPGDPCASALRAWADACSAAALQIHRLLDVAADGDGPLVAAERRRQVAVLELLAGRGAGGLRPALEVSTEGRRVLRAVVSRRARGRS